MTMQDLMKVQHEEDKKNFGRECLKLTNEFRKKHGLSALEWNDDLCGIGMPHTKRMAHKQVAFGHHGFNDRVNAVPFALSGGMFENVAYAMGYPNIPKVRNRAFLSGLGDCGRVD